MNFSRRCSVVCALVVAAHAAHYSAWSWSPADAAMTNLHPTRAEAANVFARFDSESPQQEGRFGTEGMSSNDAAVSGVAYLRVEGGPDGTEDVATFAQMKDWFVGYHRSQGQVVHELPASVFVPHHGRMLARLREMVATTGDDFVAIPFSLS